MKVAQLFEVKIDNKAGLGSTIYNSNADYFGLKVMMRPSIFLKLASPLRGDAPNNGYITNHLSNGGSIGSPFLDIDIPWEWENDDFSTNAKVIGHEGRNRMKAIMEVEGDDPLEVHLFPDGGLKAKELTIDMREKLKEGLINQTGDKLVRNPFYY
jgi:hypothetical protein